jgi:hypothetical protein
VFAWRLDKQLVSSGFDTRFIEYSPGGTTSNYNTFNLIGTIILRNNDNTPKVSVTTLHKLQTSLLASDFFWLDCDILLLVLLSYCLSRVESSLTLRQTVSRPVCLGKKHPYGAYDQIFITVGQLRIC